ncbi:unnamed protein product [Caretta caretta]
MVGPGEGARQAFLLRLHPGQQLTEKCGDRAVGTGGLRAGEASGHQPKDPLLCRKCREKREELRAFEDNWARGAFVRSCIHLLREMDRGSHFFYALEKMRGGKKHVTCLLAEDGTTLTEPVEMCGRAQAFYASLFSPDLTDPGACRVLWEELPMVSVSDRDRLEFPLTLAEFSEALRRMPTYKSPGMIVSSTVCFGTSSAQT